MRKSIVTKSKNHIVVGIDKVTGVFLQFEDKSNEMKIINFSEFSPFNRRLTAENVLAAIKNKEVLKADFEEACLIEIGNYKVYFRGIGLDVDTEPESPFEFPKRLRSHYEKGTGFKVQTIGDYFKLLKLFKTPIKFGEVQWYMNHPSISMELYYFQNDEVAV